MNRAEKLLKIAEILPQVINTKTHVRIRRGQVHSVICRVLNLPRSCANIKLIKAVLEASGIRSVVIRNRKFYVSYPDSNPATKRYRTKVLENNADK
jgi:hypothetical protein